MLAYYIEWHMRDRLREPLFDDDDCNSAQKSLRSVVARAARSKSVREKDATLRTPPDFPVPNYNENTALPDGTACRDAFKFGLTLFSPLQKQRGKDLDALTKVGHAPSLLYFSEQFSQDTGASPSFVRRS